MGVLHVVTEGNKFQQYSCIDLSEYSVNSQFHTSNQPYAVSQISRNHTIRLIMTQLSDFSTLTHY